jgi:hypothetical protein
MEARERLYRLDLPDHGIPHDQIEPIAGVEPKSLELDRQRDLSADRQTPQRKLMGQTMLVRRFQEARPENAMHLDRGVHNLSSDRLDVGRNARRVFVVFAPFVVFVFH